MKFIAKIIAGTFVVIATLFVGCAVLMSVGQKGIDKGAEYAAASGNTLAGCAANYKGPEADLCKSAVHSARLDNAVDQLDALSDALH